MSGVVEGEHVMLRLSNAAGGPQDAGRRALEEGKERREDTKHVKRGKQAGLGLVVEVPHPLQSAYSSFLVASYPTQTKAPLLCDVKTTQVHVCVSNEGFIT